MQHFAELPLQGFSADWVVLFALPAAMTKISVKVGDLLDEAVDVIISTGNPWLNTSGGVNGAILARRVPLAPQVLGVWVDAPSRFGKNGGIAHRKTMRRFHKVVHVRGVTFSYCSGLQMVVGRMLPRRFIKTATSKAARDPRFARASRHLTAAQKSTCGASGTHFLIL
jgi:hypothetical protein